MHGKSGASWFTRQLLAAMFPKRKERGTWYDTLRTWGTEGVLYSFNLFLQVPETRTITGWNAQGVWWLAYVGWNFFLNKPILNPCASSCF